MQIDYTTIYKVSLVGKICVRTEWPIVIGLIFISSLRSMKWLGIFPLSPRCCWSIAEFFPSFTSPVPTQTHFKDDKSEKGKPYSPLQWVRHSVLYSCYIPVLPVVVVLDFFSLTLAETWSSFSLLYLCPPSSSTQEWMLREGWSRKRWTITHFILYHLIWIWGLLSVRLRLIRP